MVTTGILSGQKKIIELQNEIIDRLTTIIFRHEEIGTNEVDMIAKATKMQESLKGR